MEQPTSDLAVHADDVTVPDRRHVPHVTGQRLPVPHTRTPADDLIYPPALDEAARAAEWARKPYNTRRAYENGFTVWQSYCARFGLPWTKARHGSLTGFVEWAWYDERRAYTTIDGYLTGLSVILQQIHRIDIAPGDLAAARVALGQLQRIARRDQEEERGRGRAPALPLNALREVTRSCDLTTPAGLRDRLLFTLGFTVAGRRDELAHLQVRDLTLVDEGLLVHIRVSKTDPRTVAVAYGTDPLTCPVRAWRSWQERTGLGLVAALDGLEPVLHRVHRSGTIHGALSAGGVGDIVKRAADRAGLIVPFTGHSLRAGFVTAARKAGKDAKAISDVTGHRPNSRILYGYMRDADQWDPVNNATMGIGL